MLRYSLCVSLVLENRHVIRLVRFVMASDSDMQPNFWDQRTTCAVNVYPVTLRGEQEVQQSQASRHRVLENRRQHFLDEFDLDKADGPSLIDTSEAWDLCHWCENQSWSFCAKCGKLSTRKLLPSFRAKKAPPLDNACKCGGSTYVVPQPDELPLPLRNLSEADIRILRHRTSTAAITNAWCTGTASTQALFV